MKKINPFRPRSHLIHEFKELFRFKTNITDMQQPFRRESVLDMKVFGDPWWCRSKVFPFDIKWELQVYEFNFNNSVISRIRQLGKIFTFKNSE